MIQQPHSWAYTIIQKDTCTAMSKTALFTVTKTWEQPKCPSTDEWMKMWSIYTQWNIIIQT